jgi:hypothetical protein
MNETKIDRIRWILAAKPSEEYAPMLSALAYILSMLLVRETRQGAK